MSTNHNLRRERRAEADSNRGPSAYQPNGLLLGQTSSPKHKRQFNCYTHILCGKARSQEFQHEHLRPHGRPEVVVRHSPVMIYVLKGLTQCQRRYVYVLKGLTQCQRLYVYVLKGLTQCQQRHIYVLKGLTQC